MNEYFAESDWKADKFLLNMIDCLVLRCAYQCDEHEDLHFMQDGTPLHFLLSCSCVV
jgi:hypothetical protein